MAFLVLSGLIMAMFLKSQPYDFVALAPIEIWYGVE